MNLLGNVLWLIFGGIVTSLMYFISGILLCCTIIGIPFGIQIFKIASLVLCPFGRTTVATEKANGCLATLMNIVWLFVFGLEIAVVHVLLGIILCITIIGIPFGKQHFKLATLVLTPFGRLIVNI
ncbi:MAG: YccF domain-containing protein [Rikenellaceae bacterium]